MARFDWATYKKLERLHEKLDWLAAQVKSSKDLVPKTDLWGVGILDGK